MLPDGFAERSLNLHFVGTQRREKHTAEWMQFGKENARAQSGRDLQSVQPRRVCGQGPETRLQTRVALKGSARKCEAGGCGKCRHT